MILVDTNVIYALGDSSDTEHDRSRLRPQQRAVDGTPSRDSAETVHTVTMKLHDRPRVA